MHKVIYDSVLQYGDCNLSLSHTVLGNYGDSNVNNSFKHIYKHLKPIKHIHTHINLLILANYTI